MSVGAFGAAVIAGVINLADGVQLVKQRAEMMVKLYPEGYGLGAIVGLNERQVSTLVQETYSERAPVYLANINAPLQIVIAGSNEGIKKVLQAALQDGARKAVVLDVSEPSHFPLLEPVADAFEADHAVGPLANAEADLRRQRYWQSIAKRGGHFAGPG